MARREAGFGDRGGDEGGGSDGRRGNSGVGESAIGDGWQSGRDLPTQTRSRNTLRRRSTTHSDGPTLLSRRVRHRSPNYSIGRTRKLQSTTRLHVRFLALYSRHSYRNTVLANLCKFFEEFQLNNHAHYF